MTRSLPPVVRSSRRLPRAGLRVCSRALFGACLAWPLSSPAHALTILYPGEGLKTVVTASGEMVSKALNADNPVSRGAKRVAGALDPDNWAGHLDKLDMDLTASMYHNAISGDASRSFLKSGLQTSETVNLGGKKKYGFWGGGEFEFHTALRNTDDRQTDNDKRQRVQGLYGVFRRRDDYELRAGNVSGSFSPYSLSSSADVGVQGAKSLGSKRRTGELQLYFGRPTQAIGNKTFDRHVYGLRLAALKGSVASFVDKLGLNFVRTRDYVGSIDEAFRRPANAVDNQVVSTDLSLKPVDALSLQGEFAYARTDPDTQTRAAALLHGTALKLNGAYRAPNGLGFEGTSVNPSFEQVDPDYRSTSGGGSPDGRRMSLSVNSAAALPGKLPKVSLSYTGNTSHNDLKHQLANRNTSTVHNAAASLKPFERLEGVGDGFWASLAKNASLSAAYSHTDSDASDRSAESTIRGQNYTLGTSAGRHTFSTFFNYQTTEERTAATGDRENRSVGATYARRELGWGVPASKPFSTDLTFTAQQTRDRAIDATGGSLQRSMRAGAQTKVNDDERLDLEYELAFNGNDTPNSDYRNENWKVAYVVSRFIKADGSLSMSYTSKRTLEATTARNYREQVFRGDLALKWSGGGAAAPAGRPLSQEDAARAVSVLLDAFGQGDAFTFMKLVSPSFKGDRAVFEGQVKAELERVKDVHFETVSVTSFVPDNDILEVTFVWERRARVFATGAEERKPGIGLFRLEKSGERWLLQEVRKANPLF